MEDLLKILIGAVGTIVISAVSVAVAYLGMWKRRFDKLEREGREKENHIRTLNNGFRLEVYTRLGKLEQNDEELKEDVKLIKKAIIKEEK